MDIKHPANLEEGWWESSLMELIAFLTELHVKLSKTTQDAIAAAAIQIRIGQQNAEVVHRMSQHLSKAMDYERLARRAIEQAVDSREKLRRAGAWTRTTMDVARIGRLLTVHASGGCVALHREMNEQRAQRKEILHYPVDTRDLNPDREGWIALTTKLREEMSRLGPSRMDRITYRLLRNLIIAHGWRPSHPTPTPPPKTSST